MTISTAEKGIQNLRCYLSVIQSVMDCVASDSDFLPVKWKLYAGEIRITPA